MTMTAQNNQNRRTIRHAKMALIAVASVALARLLTGGLNVPETALAVDAGTTLQGLFGLKIHPLLFAPPGFSSDFLMLLIAAILSYSATLFSFSLNSSVRIVVLFQLCLLSYVGVAALHLLTNFAARPAMLLISLLIAAAFGFLLRRIENRRRHFEAQVVELKLREKELSESRLTLVKQDETERRLLAADLHDQVLNDLKALKNKLDSYAQTQSPSMSSEIFSAMDNSMLEVRNIMDSLSPMVLELFGLASAAEECLEKGAQRAGFDIVFDNSIEGTKLKDLSSVEQQLLYRLIQESITNICKHAEASTVEISLSLEDGQLLIRVVDDGKGISANQLEESRGLRYMRLRAGLIGAAIAWVSPNPKTGKGTTVEIRSPLRQLSKTQN